MGRPAVEVGVAHLSLVFGCVCCSIGITHLRSKAGEDILIWNGFRWLSGPKAPPKCGALCTTNTGDCKQAPDYKPGEDFDYWQKLEFDEHGTVQQFPEFVDEFERDLP